MGATELQEQIILRIGHERTTLSSTLGSRHVRNLRACDKADGT
jgi:hypothetical protein